VPYQIKLTVEGTLERLSVVDRDEEWIEDMSQPLAAQSSSL